MSIVDFHSDLRVLTYPQRPSESRVATVREDGLCDFQALMDSRIRHGYLKQNSEVSVEEKFKHCEVIELYVVMHVCS